MESWIFRAYQAVLRQIGNWWVIEVTVSQDSHRWWWVWIMLLSFCSCLESADYRMCLAGISQHLPYLWCVFKRSDWAESEFCATRRTGVPQFWAWNMNPWSVHRLLVTWPDRGHYLCLPSSLNLGFFWLLVDRWWNFKWELNTSNMYLVFSMRSLKCLSSSFNLKSLKLQILYFS